MTRHPFPMGRLAVAIVIALGSTVVASTPAYATTPTMQMTIAPSDSTPGTWTGLVASLLGTGGFIPGWVTIHLTPGMDVVHADTVPGVSPNPAPVPYHPADGAVLASGDLTLSPDCVTTIQSHWNIQWDEPFQEAPWIGQVAELRADAGVFGTYYVHVIEKTTTDAPHGFAEHHYDLATDQMYPPPVCGKLRYSNAWDPAQPIFRTPSTPGRYKVITESQPSGFASIVRSTTYFWIGDGTQTPPCTIVGTPGDDVLIGSDGNDVICGVGGNDSISGLGGNDVIVTGSGSDRIDGGTGNDVILAGGGNDTVNGGGGADKVVGGPGNDVILGGSGNDVLIGSSGTDTVVGNGGLNVVDGGTGTDGCSATSTKTAYAYATGCESSP